MKRRHFLFIIISIVLFFLLAFTYKTAFVERLDLAVTLAVMNIRTEALTEFFTIITHIGGWKVTAPFWFLLGVLLLGYRQGRAFVFLTVVFWGSRTLNWELKEQFGRLRPDMEQLVEAAHFSFPSGHAMNSMAFYGAIFFLVHVYIQERRAIREFLSVFLVLLVLLIGFSRIYLGVHYFTDIVAGYSAGFAFMYSMSWLVRQKS